MTKNVKSVGLSSSAKKLPEKIQACDVVDSGALWECNKLYQRTSQSEDSILTDDDIRLLPSKCQHSISLKAIVDWDDTKKGSFRKSADEKEFRKFIKETVPEPASL